MNRICRVSISAEACPGSDSPILNYSAEQPDQLFFFGTIYGSWNPYQPSPMGGLFIAKNCAGSSYSGTSQEAADLLAQDSGVICTGAGLAPAAPGSTITTQTPSGPASGPVPVVENPSPDHAGNYLVSNSPQTATGSCSSLATFTYTCPAGTFSQWITIDASDPAAAGPSILAAQARVDDKALAYAQQRVAHYDYCVFCQQASGDIGICLNAPYVSSPGPLFSLTNSSGHVIWTSAGLPPGISISPSHSTAITDSGGNTWMLTKGGQWTNLTTGATQGTQPAGTASGDVGSVDLIGTPSKTGDFPFTITATDTGGGTSAQYKGTIHVLGFTNTSPLPDGQLCNIYNLALGADGGTPPYSYNVDPSTELPWGMTIANNALYGQVAVGSYAFKLIVFDKNGRECSQPFALTIDPPPTLVITTGSPLPTGHVGHSYNTAVEATGGCPGPNVYDPSIGGKTTPYSWTVLTGTLPNGLWLVHFDSGAFAITGVPTLAGTSTFRLQVTDSVGATAGKDFSLTVDADIVVTGSCANNPGISATGSAPPVASQPGWRPTAATEEGYANAIDDLISQLQGMGCGCPPCSVQVDPVGNETTITNTSATCTLTVHGFPRGDVIGIAPGEVFNYYNYSWLFWGGPPPAGNYNLTLGGGVIFNLTYTGT